MRTLLISLVMVCCAFLGISYAQDVGHTHQSHIHKHPEYAAKKNPVPMSEQSVALGKELFGKHCVGCHGEGGRAAGNLNLSDDKIIHGDSDGEIFHVISDGVKKTQMKAFKKDLSEASRWNLVNYVKSLKSGAASDNPVVRPGRQIRKVDIKGYTLTYHLLDLSERGEMVEHMDRHKVLGMKKSADATNHLMVYIQKPDGKIVPGDVAFLVTGPDGKEFKTITMGMYGGYGVDINLKLKGSYVIRTNIGIEGGAMTRLSDEFSYQER